MPPLRRQLILNGLELFDVLALAGSFLAGVVAYSQRLQFDLAEVLALRLKVSNLVLMVGFLSVAHVVLRANGLYESHRLSTLRSELGDICKAVIFCALLLAAAAVLFKLEVVAGRSFLVAFCATSAATLMGSRILLRHTLAHLRRRGRNLRRVLIVGTNRRAIHMARRIQRRPELGYEIVGFADDPWPGLYAFQRLGYTLRTDLQRLSEFIRESVVDEVFIFLPLKSAYGRIGEIVEWCDGQGIIVRLMGRLFDVRTSQTRAETFEEEILVSVYAGRMDGWPVLIKRALDIFGSIVLLGLTAPVFLVAAAAITLTSAGPVFFVQERVGINKRRFCVLKFRTMVVDAEHHQDALEPLNEVPGPVFKIRSDPRITAVGRVLRKTSVDELPQLINVLKGDMSLVGPRPLPVRDYHGFDQDWHRRRFSVRPGITCLWQVNGRSRLTFDRWMELDMQYIDQWSLWLDVKILLKTVPAVLKGYGAA